MILPNFTHSRQSPRRGGARAIQGRIAAALSALALLLASHTALATVNIKPRVNVDAPDASVRLLVDDGKGAITLKQSGKAPFQAAETIRIRDTDTLVVEAEAPDHAPATKRFDHAWCKANEGKGDVLPIDLTLPRIRESMEARLENAPPGAVITVNDAGGNRSVSADTTLVFRRQDDGTPWETVIIRVEAPGFEARSLTVTRDQLASAAATGGRRPIDLRLESIRESRPLRVFSNVPETRVIIAGVTPASGVLTPSMTNEPLALEFSFTRASATGPWNRLLLRAEKEGHEWLPPDTEAKEVFEQTFEKSDVERLGGTIAITHFAKLQYVRTRVLRYFVDSREARLGETNIMASVSENEAGGEPRLLVERGQGRSERFLLSRLSVPRRAWADAQPADNTTPGSGQRTRKLFFAMANYDFGADGSSRIAGSSLYYWQQGSPLPVALTTRPQDYAMDPCVSPDGRYVFFSALVNNVRGICRVSTGGGIPFMITESERYIDTEPTVADRYRLAFTRRTVNAPPGAHPSIYVQAEEGGQIQERLFGRVADGHSPALSPGGMRLAFVDAQGRLCVADASRGWQPQPVSDGGAHAFPSWVDERTLYFAMEKDRNERGALHYDVFRVEVAADGSVGRTQWLTRNGSLDTAPVVSEDGKDFYFLSNRGARRHGEEWLQIFIMGLPVER